MTFSVVAIGRAVQAVAPAAVATTAAAEQVTPADWSAISDLLYAAQPVDGGVQFVNRAHGLSATLGAAGTVVNSDGATVSLRLASLGRGVSMIAMGGSPAITRDGAQGTLTHAFGSAQLDEWWINRPGGLEHGFTFVQRPAGVGALRLEMELGGSLMPVLASPTALAFVGSSLRYEGLRVWDATGKDVPVHFEIRERNLSIVTDDSAATYPLTIDPTFVSQDSYLKASNTGSNDRFGDAIAIHGDTIVVGASEEDSAATGVNGDQASNAAAESGAVYVFTRNAAGWSQQAYLKASNTGADDEFGSSVAIDGDTIVVGAPFEDSNAAGVNGNQADNTAANSGAAYVFTQLGTTWTQQAYLKPSNTGADDEFGHAVAISGDTIVVGAYGEDSNGTPADNSSLGAGAAYVFARSAATWSEQAYIKAPSIDVGDEFGRSVGMDGDSLIVGAWAEDSVATGVNGNHADDTSTDSGAAYVFTRNGAVWTQQAYIKASTNGSIDGFGWAVAMDGDTAVVGAPYEDSNAVGINGSETSNLAATSGAAYVFTRSGTTWTQQAYVKASNTAVDDQFGYSVSVAGDTFVAGAWFEDSQATGVNGLQNENSSGNAGAAYVFTRSGSAWTQLAYLKASNTGLTDTFGLAVAVDGGTVVVGAPAEGSDATGVNGDQADNSSASAGAVYAYSTTSAFPDSTYVKASNTAADDQFGYAVAVDGNTVVVGAWAEDSNATGVNGDQLNNSATTAGAAYVFTRSGSTWSQQAYLKASNTGGLDQFGKAVAIDGDTIVVGALGEDSNATGVGGDQSNDGTGQSGAAYVFTRSGSTWSQQAYLKASNTDLSDQFGWSVAIDGETIVVGANNEDSAATGVDGDQSSNTEPSSGAAYVFTRSGTTWSQQAYLKASNTESTDEFGGSVAIDRDTIVVGARYENSDATGVDGNEADESAGNSGAAYVFARSGSAWSQQAYLKASNTGAGDEFGLAVAIDGDLVVVGAPEEDSKYAGINADQNNEQAGAAGAAYVFARSGSAWSHEAYLKASNASIGDNFGYSVGIGGETIVIGAKSENSIATGVNGDQGNQTGIGAGAAHVFVRTADARSQRFFLKASTTGTHDVFGWSIATDGETIAVGAIGEDSDATGIGGDEDDDSLNSAGAAYIFFLYGCVEPPFVDVAVAHPFCAEIRWMAETGISTGFDDGTYQPASNVTRQAMSAFMARLAGATLTDCTSPPFTDVPTNHPFCSEIQWMKDEGISTGFPDATYRPGLAVTRQAMSAFMARLAGATLTSCTVAPFSDVDINHSFCEEIKWMKESGVSTGFSDGTYRPGIAVTRQAMSAFLYRVDEFVE